MKKVLLVLAIPFFILGHYFYFWGSQNEFKIIQRAFTIGGWQACEKGPTLYERYASNLAYYHLKAFGVGKSYVTEGGSLVNVALGVSKCAVNTAGYDLDNARVKRGIDLGLKYGENINGIYTNGLRPTHTATMINNPYLLQYLMKQGANISLKSEPLSFMMPRAMTPLEYAADLESSGGLDLKLVKSVLEKND